MAVSIGVAVAASTTHPKHLTSEQVSVARAKKDGVTTAQGFAHWQQVQLQKSDAVYGIQPRSAGTPR